MPKLKSHSGAKKRFNLTKNGKVKRCPCVQEPHSYQEGYQALPSSAFYHLCGCDYRSDHQKNDSL